MDNPKIIKERLGRYSADGLADALHFMRATLDGEDRRVDVLERKATILVGYSGAIIAIAVPWVLPLVRTTDAVFLAIRIAGGLSLITALAAICFAFAGFRARTGWSNPEPGTLLPGVPAEGFDLVKLRAFWVTALYGLYERHRALINKKADWVLRAQWALIGSIVLLTFAIAVGLWTPPTQSSKDRSTTTVAQQFLEKLASLPERDILVRRGAN